MPRIKPNYTLMLLDKLVYNPKKNARSIEQLVNDDKIQPTLIMSLQEVYNLLSGLSIAGLNVKDDIVTDQWGNVIIEADAMYGGQNFKVTYKKYHPAVGAERTRAGGPYVYKVIENV